MSRQKRRIAIMFAQVCHADVGSWYLDGAGHLLQLAKPSCAGV